MFARSARSIMSSKLMHRLTHWLDLYLSGLGMTYNDPSAFGRKLRTCVPPYLTNWMPLRLDSSIVMIPLTRLPPWPLAPIPTDSPTLPHTKPTWRQTPLRTRQSLQKLQSLSRLDPSPIRNHVVKPDSDNDNRHDRKFAFGRNHVRSLISSTR